MPEITIVFLRFLFAGSIIALAALAWLAALMTRTVPADHSERRPAHGNAQRIAYRQAHAR
jgi:hypothetical protein